MRIILSIVSTVLHQFGKGLSENKQSPTA